MKPEQIVSHLTGVVILALYALMLDGSGVEMKERWNKLKGWSGK